MKNFQFKESIICPTDKTASKSRILNYKDYYKIKYTICKEVNPKIIVEIGVRAGYSAWAFLQACPNSKYIGIDANNGTHGGQGGEDHSYFNWAKFILKEYTCEFIELDTQIVENLSIRNIDFFHIDGDHTSKGVMHDLDLAVKCLSSEGVILVDDIDYIKSVKEGVNFWLSKNPLWKSKYIKSFRGEMLISYRG